MRVGLVEFDRVGVGEWLKSPHALDRVAADRSSRHQIWAVSYTCDPSTEIYEYAGVPVVDHRCQADAAVSGPRQVGGDAVVAAPHEVVEREGAFCMSENHGLFTCR